MGDRKSEGLGVELRRRKKVDTTPIYFSSNTRVLLAPWLLLAGAPSGPRAIERKTQAKAWAKLSWPFGP